MSMELVTVERAVAEFDRVAAGLKALQDQYGGVIYDVATPQGMSEAREARRALREPRVEIEKIRKSAKAPILELGRKLDSEAARITRALSVLEDPIDEQVRRREQQIEDARQAKINAELARVANLQERVAELRGNPNLSAASGSTLIAQHLADLSPLVVDGSFEEYAQQARDARDAGLKRLQLLHAAALALETEQSRIVAEREELAKLRAEQALREAAERARLAEEARVATAARDAAQAEQEARWRSEREALAKAAQERQAADRAAQERLQAERDALAWQAAEQRRLEAEAASKLVAERAAFEAQQAEVRRQERQAAEERGRGERFEAATDAELAQVVADHYGVTAPSAFARLCKIKRAA